ncbi:BrnT family toxin [Candidatus Thiosymbion oneisti]|uniref:BrnT family toxin n=1 Tax=Candidatus Thiosymbion oneisti TaxID=589554 RepID=UPI000B7DBFD7|nr:BrnT family toxin [Candidatus Thiosymbion oneisti]
MLFEWDEKKRGKTLRERGIDFIDAARIWEDPHRQERLDSRSKSVEYNETRIQTIGRVTFGILLVVYTKRANENGKEVIRIISARKANGRERVKYLTKAFLPY